MAGLGISCFGRVVVFPSRIPRLPVKFGQLREAGVRMLIGTDSGIPSMFHTDSTWREMVKWIELGVPAMEVIQSATLWPARFLKQDADFGTVEAGKYADLIVVPGDPLTDMSVLTGLTRERRALATICSARCVPGPSTEPRMAHGCFSYTRRAK